MQLEFALKVLFCTLLYSFLDYVRLRLLHTVHFGGLSHDFRIHFVHQTYFFVNPKEVLTIGIGDGGNEIGMGNVAHRIKESLDIIPSIITVNHLIAATVSNWGVFGLIAALSLQTSQNLLPEPEAVWNFIKAIVDKGAVDGTTGAHSYTVDGFDFEIERQILLSLYQINGKSVLLPKK